MKMKHGIAFAAAMFGAASLSPAMAADAAPVVLAVTAARMVDVLAGTELAKPVVIITDGRVARRMQSVFEADWARSGGKKSAPVRVQRTA